jgi:hypothetical protein
MLPLFNRSEEDNALLLRLVSEAGIDIQMEANESGGLPEVTMPMLREHEGLLQLLMHGWLQADSCLDVSGVLCVRRCSAAFGLWCSLERVRAKEAHAYSHTSPLACRYVCCCIASALVVYEHQRTCSHRNQCTCHSEHKLPERTSHGYADQKTMSSRAWRALAS